MANLPGFLLTILFFLGYGVFALPTISIPLSSTPPPLQVCSTVNRLNVRSGPGTTYEVVAGMVFGQCATQLELSADQEWVRTDLGWVSAKFVETKEGLPEPASTVQPALSTNAQAAATPLATTRPTAAFQQGPQAGKESPVVLAPTALKNWFSTNPVKASLLLVTFYVGLVSAQKFTFKRQILNGFLTLLLAAAAAVLLNYNVGRHFGQYSIPLNAASLTGFAGASLGGYVGGLMLGRLIYRGPRSVERGADTKCSVCDQKQRHNRMRICPACHKPYCDFPAWNHSSIRDAIDGIVIWIAIPLGVILTAVSIFGGVIVLATLSVPYLLLRELLPENRRPAYWKNCGRSGYCFSCAARLVPVVSTVGSSSGGSSDERDDSRDDNRNDDRDTKDDDDDQKDDRSIWDGWLMKW